MKNSLDGINSTTDTAEENVSELKDKAIETIQTETKNLKKTEKKWISDPLDAVKWFSICVISVAEEEKEGRLEKILRNFQNLIKHELKVPGSSINLKPEKHRYIPRHLITKLLKSTIKVVFF